MSPKSRGHPIRATIAAVHREYLVLYPEDSTILPRGENITCSRHNWQGKQHPEKGQVVILTDILRYAKGWRARKARPVTLADERRKD